MDDQVKKWALNLDGVLLGRRYRVGRPLGVGGMGAVFGAVHQAMGRSVAVKLLFPELTRSEEAVRRFQQEAQSAAAIARRGVVDILDFDQDPDHGPFLVMEMLQGESLLRRIKTRGRLSLEDALGLAMQMVETLATVHEAGVIHRDLKPANVFLAQTEEGEEVVKLLDFGISRVAPQPGCAPLTVPGTVLGTPRFMAPEQAACDPSVDHRADLYSVGSILYYAVSGTKPYAHLDKGALLVGVIQLPPTPLRQVSPGLPQVIYELIGHSMERERDQRFQSAQELGEALRLARQRLPRGELSLTADDDFAPTAVEARPGPMVTPRGDDQQTVPEIPAYQPATSSSAAAFDEDATTNVALEPWTNERARNSRRPPPTLEVSRPMTTTIAPAGPPTPTTTDAPRSSRLWLWLLLGVMLLLVLGLGGLVLGFSLVDSLLGT